MSKGFNDPSLDELSVGFVRGRRLAHLFRRLTVFSLVVALLSATGAPAQGQDVSLSLSDCVKIGVTDNLGILKKDFEKDEKKYDIEMARKIFVPAATLNISESEETKKNAALDQGISGMTRDGTRWGVRTNANHDLPPQAENFRSHSFSLTRPLLKNFGRRVSGHDLDLSKIDYDIGIEKFKADLNAFVFHLSEIYFDLSYARRNLAIQESAVQRARQQFDDTRHDIELGTIAEQEIYLVEENLVEFEIKRETARHEIALLQLELKKILNIDPASDTCIIPDEASLEVFDAPATFTDSLTIALSQNPDLVSKNLFHQRSINELDFQKTQFLPQLDLKVDYRWREGKDISKNNSYQMGFQYEIPLDRDPDRAKVDKTRLNTRIQFLSLQDARVFLTAELKKAFLEIEHLESIHHQKTRAVDLSKKKLDAETEKYKNGFSTLADVVRFQRELESSMIDEYQTFIALKKARLNRQLLEGTLYKKFGIDIRS